MVYAIILAGGKGNRMGLTEMPKQFLYISNKPIIIHTIEKFILHAKIDKIIVLVPREWINHTIQIIDKYIQTSKKIDVVVGGSTRNETIMNAIDYIEVSYGLDENTIVITHDSVRPFVSHRIIDDNIEALRNCDACDTVIPATDTIVESDDGNIISNIPIRTKMYQGQTPQSFKAIKLKELYGLLSDQEKDILTDAAKIFVISGYDVKLVVGDGYNIKITFPYDLKISQSLLGVDIND